MVIDIITIFPEMFDSPMSTSMIGIARDRGHLELRVHNLRDYAVDRHRSTDDYPYGGGPGMVMKPEPLFAAVHAVESMPPGDGTIVFLTPGGTPFNQEVALDLSTHGRLILVCGRYEGFDERALSLADIQLSIGDYVTTGGELPAMVVVDTVTRLLPGVLGDESSIEDESFSHGLLEYPQYTRPEVYEGMSVPSVLLSGDHAKIARFRREQAIIRTARVRPDLIESARLTNDEHRLAEAARKESGSE